MQDEIMSLTYEKVKQKAYKYPIYLGFGLGIIVFLLMWLMSKKFDWIVLVASLVLGNLYVFLEFYQVNKNYGKTIENIYGFTKSKYDDLELFIPCFMANKKQYYFRSALIIRHDELFMEVYNQKNRKKSSLDSISVELGKDIIVKNYEVIDEKIKFNVLFVDQPYEFVILNVKGIIERIKPLLKMEDK